MKGPVSPRKAARKVAGLFPAHATPKTIGMVLMNHGLFSFGATETDPSGENPTIDSKEMRETLAFAKALFDEGMTPEVFSWDDASDNTPRGPLWPFPEEKHRPRGVACAARRTH